MKNSYLIKFIFLISFLSTNASAQSNLDSSSFGIVASFQSGQTEFLIPIRVTTMISLIPGFGISSIKDAGTEIRFALLTRFYLSKNNASPFIGGRIGTIIYSPKIGDALKDLVVGISGGGEYFFNKNFSAGIECGLNLGLADKHSVRFGSPGGKVFSSSTSLFATIYF